MRIVFKELGGIAAAFVMWWSAAVLLGMVMFAIWPSAPGTSYVAGVSLEPQNVPGNLVGFIVALYAFRSVTAQKSRGSNEVTTHQNDA